MMKFIRRSALVLAGAAPLAIGAGFIGQSVPFVAPAVAQSSNADLARAVSALRGIATMRADFTQTDRAGNTVRGTMTLKRPGKIRFDYGRNADLLVVSNGRSLYMIDYEVDQVERWPIGNSPLGALLDPDRDVKQYGTLIPTGSSQVVSVDVRDPDKPEYGRIIMNFISNPNAPGGLQLMNWVAVDAQNHRTTVRLTNHRYGVNVPNSTFRFCDPRRSSCRSR